MTSTGSRIAPHVPVLVSDVVTALQLHGGETVVDGTFGAGGYTRALLSAGAGRVIGFDRDPDAIECIVGAPSKVSDDIAECREETRWFPAMVSNHVMDLIERYGEDSEIPKDLTDYVKARKFYDYKDHSREGAAHGEFVTDEICDRFSVIGNVEQVTEKLKELESIGVDHYNIYLMTHGQEDILRAYGSDIIPQFKGAAV